MVNLRKKKKDQELVIIDLLGSKYSYGYFVINKAGVEQAEDIVFKEKYENDEYSNETVVERLKREGINVYTQEYHSIDFGM